MSEAPPLEAAAAPVVTETEIPAAPVAEVPPEPVVPPPPARSAPRSEPLQQAIEHVNEIIGALREVLEDLDDVSGLLEVAESQKKDDERELEHLRRLLSQLQRAREHLPSKGDGRRPPHRTPQHTPRPQTPAADEPANEVV